MDDSHNRFMVAQTQIETEAERVRPFMMLRPKLYQDGNQWCALYGDNLTEGVCGFGASPSDTSIAFDLAWFTKLNETSGGG